MKKEARKLMLFTYEEIEQDLDNPEHEFFHKDNNPWNSPEQAKLEYLRVLIIRLQNLKEIHVIREALFHAENDYSAKKQDDSKPDD